MTTLCLFVAISSLGNPCQFVKPQRQVDVLHRLRRRTLEQVVQCRDDDDALATRRYSEAADLDMMTVRYPADPRRIIDNLHERPPGITLTIARPDCLDGGL